MMTQNTHSLMFFYRFSFLYARAAPDYSVHTYIGYIYYV